MSPHHSSDARNDHNPLSAETIVYRNPKPVVVLLVPIETEQGIGLLTVRRNLPDGFSKLALPGGYQNEGEQWRRAGAREIEEEALLTLRSPEVIKIFDVHDSTDCRHILIFGIAELVRSEDLPQFTPNPEVSERVVITSPCQLAFPTHTEVARRFFSEVVPGLLAQDPSLISGSTEAGNEGSEAGTVQLD